MDTDKAAIEADFVGTRTGEFAGIQPAGRAVRVPCSVIYDLRPDQISALPDEPYPGHELQETRTADARSAERADARPSALVLG